MIDEMCGGLRHAPGVARRADASPLAGEGQRQYRFNKGDRPMGGRGMGPGMGAGCDGMGPGAKR